jgi:excinuclease ABC subunit A
MHNLKNIDVEIPKNLLIVVTGVSGSGKSSLTIDTLFAEGQRRYVESLSSYARQFLTRMDKPDVDYIHGLCPAIAIEQKSTSRSSRSTVGSMTELFDFLRLLYARIGKTYSPISGQLVTKHQVRDIVEAISRQAAGTKAYLTFPLAEKSVQPDLLKRLMQKGFTRLWDGKTGYEIEELLEQLPKELEKQTSIWVLVDRLVVSADNEEMESRIADSTETCFREAQGRCNIFLQQGDKISHLSFNGAFEADGIQFEEPSPDFFNFNNPYGACSRCEGFGSVMGLDEQLIFPDRSLSVYEQAIAPWRGEKMSEWLEPLIKKGILFDFPIHRAIKDLSEKEIRLLWTGNEYFHGLEYFFKYLEEKSYKIQYRVMLSRFRGKTVCPDCGGSRIRKDALYVKVGEKTIGELLQMPVQALATFIDNLTLSITDQQIAERLLTEVKNRLSTLKEVGLGYLTLNRMAGTLSGGETQRIHLTRSIGSNLTGSMYILDEPSIGLHQKDTRELVNVLKKLKNLGNTVIIVEHDEDIMREADYIIDVGPEAGIHGGQIVFNGPATELIQSQSLTARYLRNELEILVPRLRRKPINFIELKGVSMHNLKNIQVKIPMQAFTVVCGVSGSGKSTLIRKVFYPALLQLMGESGEKPGAYEKLSGPWKQFKQIELIDQNPLGRSSRSNPVTFVKAYDGIRELFARQPLSKQRGYQPKDFSFNVEGGRCEACKGDGEVVVEMQFLADVHLTCESCKGKKFKEDILEVTYEGKNIFDILDMSIEEGLNFFKDFTDVRNKLQPLSDVGLGYVKLGQSSSTLSGGEAQRVKLASFLSRTGNHSESILFIFDEPTTGLHFHDIGKLMKALQALTDAGHTVVVIEHNIDVIKCADWVIELGPTGGDSGGHLLYAGQPEGLLKVKNSPTAPFLKLKLPAK